VEQKKEEANQERKKNKNIKQENMEGKEYIN
jgi:hypothetical protein